MRRVTAAIILAVAFLLQACSSVPLNVGPGSALGAGGIPTTRALLNSDPNLHAGVDAFLATEQSNSKRVQVKSLVDDSLSTDFAKTLEECKKVFTNYENQANALRWTSFGIAMVGTVAGAVIVPALAVSAAAHKAAIAAWGGLSGAANSAQNVLNQEGLSAQELVKTREAIRARFEDALKEYFDPKSTEDLRITALQKAAAACVSYAVNSPSTQIQTGTK
ncbi:hypothetical protein [Paraburkholderia terrae]|uniref:hypothetical protein n=1 Tax=Paraburkholderia terrae TaxID=311230 RepID=UPI00204AB93D|nr:hypothetical protein [Paraburkholderia terrae]BDC46019.1 hypothetical protein PTKU15_93160 [Paraburkholderia terrae]